MYSYLHIKNNKECYQPYKVEVKVKFVNAYNALRMVLNTEKALNKYCSKIQVWGLSRQARRNQWWFDSYQPSDLTYTFSNWK